MNQLQIIGHVGRDAELTYTPNGDAVARFSVAVSYKGKDGKENTTWFSCALWGKQAENLAQYVLKGTKVFAQGRVGSRAYTDKSGATVASLDVSVDRIELLSKSSPPAASQAPSGAGDGDAGFPF